MSGYYGSARPQFSAPYTASQGSFYDAPYESNRTTNRTNPMYSKGVKPPTPPKSYLPCAIGCCISLLLIIAGATVPVVVLLLVGPTATMSTLPFTGVRLSYNPATLPSSWSVCHTGTYATTLTSVNLPSVLAACSKKMLLLGCRVTGNSVLDVAAVGYRADVLYDCGTTSTCRNVANGVGWYYSNTWSWGFANGTDTVNRVPPDTMVVNSAYRLSWYTTGSAGYRCGSAYIASTSYERVIYHSD